MGLCLRNRKKADGWKGGDGGTQIPQSCVGMWRSLDFRGKFSGKTLEGYEEG